MSVGKRIIPFFTDNDVDDAVGDFLKDSGHNVVRLRDDMLENSADPVVATACREGGYVLITHNVKHFKRIAREYGVAKGEVDGLCRIEMECHQVDSVERIRVALPTIEFEWDQLGDQKRGLRIAVGKKIVRVHK
ncbi:DUF5615 family PIN-like protein [bacterium]|nr:DUF5615 family PIN-like protein [bacterium]